MAGSMRRSSEFMFTGPARGRLQLI